MPNAAEDCVELQLIIQNCSMSSHLSRSNRFLVALLDSFSSQQTPDCASEAADRESHGAKYSKEVDAARVTLYLCWRCLRMLDDSFQYFRHSEKCAAKKIPGNIIYIDRSFVVREVNGSKHPLFGMRLMILEHLFFQLPLKEMGPKKLSFYTFYRLVDCDLCWEEGDSELDETRIDELQIFIGFFTRSHRESFKTTINSLLVFSHFRNRGYAKTMIDFSYKQFSEMKIAGRPERPFSRSGEFVFRSYWIDAISRALDFLVLNRSEISVAMIEKLTSVHHLDQLETLKIIKDVEELKNSENKFDLERKAELESWKNSNSLKEFHRINVNYFIKKNK
ncbi:MAG: Histone acetyltransferase [Marteilia pararefringens]